MKINWLHLAELVDSFRVFPRMVLLGYAYFVYQVTFFILNWYAHEPALSRGVEESAVVGVVVTAVTGFSPMIYRIYADSSRDWNASPPSSVTSTVTATQVTKS
jgi:hypothetical protein